MSIKSDILGYLVVLNSKKVWNCLTFEEKQEGLSAVIGCYSRLMEALEKDVMNTEYRVLYMSIQRREMLNARCGLPVGHPKLVNATEKTAALLLAHLRGSVSFEQIKKNFGDQLKERFDDILKQYSPKGFV